MVITDPVPPSYECSCDYPIWMIDVNNELQRPPVLCPQHSIIVISPTLSEIYQGQEEEGEGEGEKKSTLQSATPPTYQDFIVATHTGNVNQSGLDLKFQNEMDNCKVSSNRDERY